MTPLRAVVVTPSPQDQRILGLLDMAVTICLVATAAIGVGNLVGWALPVIGGARPAMQVYTAVALLFTTAGLALGRWSGRLRWKIASKACGVVVLSIVAAAAIAHGAEGSANPLAALVPDAALRLAARMSPQSVLWLGVMGGAIVIGRITRGALGVVADLLVIALVLLLLLYVAAYLFGAEGLIAHTQRRDPAPWTLVSFALLTVVLIGRRTFRPPLAVLTGVGIGSHVARVMLPVSVVLSFALIRLGERLYASGTMSLSYAATLTAAGMAALLVILVVVLAGRINRLEADLRAVALADDLSGFHNRRGFDLVGAQVLREARRAGTPLTVIYVDADDLKRTNDTLGHHAGTALLRDIAGLLREAFRSSDVLGRIGGDEFAVLALGSREEVAAALRRLDEATAELNRDGRRPYSVGFSMGEVAADPTSDETLGELLARADEAMYEQKRHRHVGRNGRS